MKKSDLTGLSSLIEKNDWNRNAIMRTLELLPKRLSKEYTSKLKSEDQHPGIIHELRLIGRLLARSGDDFKCSPFPSNSHVDAILILVGTMVELEITAGIEPEFARSVRRIEVRVSQRLEALHPMHRYDVGFRTPGGGFPEIQSERRLDGDALERQLLEELHRVIRHDGSIDPILEEEPLSFRLLVEVLPAAGESRVHHSIRLPGGTDVDQVLRVVQRKTQHSQWSGNLPGILAVVLEHWPDAHLLETLKDNRKGEPISIADRAFAEDPILAAIIAVPCNVEETCRVTARPIGQAGMSLNIEALASLRLAFDFRYGDEGD